MKAPDDFNETKQFDKKHLKELFGYEIGDIRLVDLIDGSKEYYYLQDSTRTVGLSWKKAEEHQVDNYLLKRLAKSLNNYYTVEEVDV